MQVDFNFTQFFFSLSSCAKIMPFILNVAHFLLTNLLLDKLKAVPFGKIINVSAVAHKAASLHFDDPNLDNNYSSREAYGHSKLAQLLCARHLSKKLEGTRVTVNSVHPGLVKNTKILRHTGVYNSFYEKLATPITWLLLKTPKDGAQTVIYVAVAPETETITGKYFSDCEIKKPSEDAVNEDYAQKMWDLSSKLVGLQSDK
ncbi:Retinol dehydrogenase 12 [Chamberlinius hualienensis]